jgi:hypothetical protein
LVAINGQGALHWSISPLSTGSEFVTGLAIDANSGVISGTATFGGTGGFLAQVTDSASPAHTATRNFNITAYAPITSASSQTASVSEFQNTFGPRTNIQGGFPPVRFTVISGSMPPGMKFDNNGQLSGSAYATGTYQFTLTATDSFSPPEVATQPFTITVQPPLLSVANSIPARIVLNRPFSANVVALGGTPPYTFALASQTSMPPGLKLDSNTGGVSGSPSTAGSYVFSIAASDSSSPHQTASAFFNVQIAAPVGRNDSPATATPIGNGFFQASMSPYIDPTNGTPTPGDNDYYKLVSMSGSIVHLQTNAKENNPNNPLDTVIEIVDGNGQQLTTCRQPGDTGTTFASACINDDISDTPHLQDSALDLQVPGAANAATTFYVHVFDFRGDSRPDMTYGLGVSGITGP